MGQAGLIDRIFSTKGGSAFEELALEVFRFQYGNNPVYHRFCHALGRTPETVRCLEQVPFLPVEMFKHHRVVSFEGEAEAVFQSSGTTSSVTGKTGAQGSGTTSSAIPDGSSDKVPGGEPARASHYVKDLKVYERSFTEGFARFYGDPSRYCVLALLPSYLEREGSSLVYMAGSLIKQSGHPDSGFYLDEYDRLMEVVERLTDQGKDLLLLGVSFALLDLAEAHPTKMKKAIVMETGGMKGRRPELVREALHQRLMEAFGLDRVHSEYGMTELLSQAWSDGEGRFVCPPWMRVLIRDSNDPLCITDGRKAGGINVVDLANLYSCSFLATQDLGKRCQEGAGDLAQGSKKAGKETSEGCFEVLGRFDHSDVRGCNLMVSAGSTGGR